MAFFFLSLTVVFVFLFSKETMVFLFPILVVAVVSTVSSCSPIAYAKEEKENITNGI